MYSSCQCLTKKLYSDKIFKFLSSNFSGKATSKFRQHLKDVLRKKINKDRATIKIFKKECGDCQIGKITLKQIYGGMRGVPAVLWETSQLHPRKGITFRGQKVKNVMKKLPKSKYCGKMPLPEGLFWFMCTGKIPTLKQAEWVSNEWAKRSRIPEYVMEMLMNFPRSLHPMTQLSCAITAMSECSHSRRAYAMGVNKKDYWEYVYEDVMDLCGKIIVIAAYIYNHNYHNTANKACVDLQKDWSWNFTSMLGKDDEQIIDLFRMYLIVHSDHGGGCISGHSAHLVGSVLGDPYISWGAGINGLAGPKHGMASQQMTQLVQCIEQELCDDFSENKIKDFCKKLLKCGGTIPGFGHSVLRVTDPRFKIQERFAKKHIRKSRVFKIVSRLCKVVPGLLKDSGKVANPWPNADAISGVLFYHYGITQMEYYNVVFTVSRTLGILASLIWSRALELPIERPESLSSRSLMKKVQFNPKNGKDNAKESVLKISRCSSR